MIKNNVDCLSNLIRIESDLDLIRYKNYEYTNVMKNSQKDLSRWLYCVLHAGNEQLYTSNFNVSGKNLSDVISDSVVDTKINVKGVKVENMIEIGGVFINKQPIGNEIQLSCFRPNLTPGFFMYVHSDSHNLNKFRHYISANTPEYAIDIWSRAINNLVKKGVRFSAKILSNSDSYPRNDAMVFYSNEDVLLVQEELANLTQKYHENAKTSPLCEKLGINLGYAEQPLTLDGIRKSFGEHRCNAIAASIKDVFTTGMDFEVLLKQRFLNDNINPNNIAKGLRM